MAELMREVKLRLLDLTESWNTLILRLDLVELQPPRIIDR
jgi:hypothetical protein